jgi:benzoylformate decarboxylase
LICGTYVLPEVFPVLGDIFAPGSKTIHIDLNLYEVAKNHPVDLGMLGDPKLTLAALAGELERLITPMGVEAVRARTARYTREKETKRKAQMEKDSTERNAVPLQMSEFMEELMKQLDGSTLIFDEALTSSPAVSRYFSPSRTGQYFLTRGGSLGVGIPGATGVKWAHPDKTVIGFTGDGGAMYTIQALWTAARYNVDAKYVVCNNSSYRLLQVNIAEYWKERGIPKHDFPISFDLSRPQLHFADMAKSMGVAGVRVEKPEEIAPAIRKALAHKGPFLIDLVIQGDTRPDLIENSPRQSKTAG